MVQGHALLYWNWELELVFLHPRNML